MGGGVGGEGGGELELEREGEGEGGGEEDRLDVFVYVLAAKIILKSFSTYYTLYWIT